MSNQNNYANLNNFRFRFRNKKTGYFSYDDRCIFGDINDIIKEYKDNLSKMCLLGVSNETHTLVQVIHLFNDKTIYSDYMV